MKIFCETIRKSPCCIFNLLEEQDYFLQIFWFLKGKCTLHTLLEISANTSTKAKIKNGCKKWLFKIRETFYQHFVIGFTMFQQLKFVLPWYGETLYQILVVCFTQLTETAF